MIELSPYQYGRSARKLKDEFLIVNQTITTDSSFRICDDDWRRKLYDNYYSCLYSVLYVHYCNLSTFSFYCECFRIHFKPCLELCITDPLSTDSM